MVEGGWGSVARVWEVVRWWWVEGVGGRPTYLYKRLSAAVLFFFFFLLLTFGNNLPSCHRVYIYI